MKNGWLKFSFLAIVLVGAGALLVWKYPSAFSLRSQVVVEYRSSALAAVGGAVKEPPPPKHIETPKPVRAIYMTSWVAGIPTLRGKLLQFARDSEVNAMIIDVKDYSGKISYDMGDALIKESGAEEIRVKDMPQFIQELHRNNIYIIARITAFQDPVLARAKPEVAIKRKNGSIWKDAKGLAWVDPGSRAAWEYIVRVARNAERAGFDELNFDYVRYPTDGDLASMAFNIPSGKTKSDVMEAYFKYLHEHLGDLPVPISVDLFGLTTIRTDDMNIGQVMERAAPYVDYIAPMVYPSHYPKTFMGYKNPAEHPYEIILDAMRTASKRLIAASSSPTKLRPWIQDFDLGATYNAPMIRKQKQAIYDAGLDSWMSWDPKNLYTTEAYIDLPALPASTAL